MPSCAEQSPMRRLRRQGEWALRALLILSLLVAIRHALFEMNEHPSSGAAGGDGRLRESLADWSTGSSPHSATLRIDSVLSRTTRDWISDMRGAGTSITWTSSLAAAGIAVEPIVDPKGTSRIW